MLLRVLRLLTTVEADTDLVHRPPRSKKTQKHINKKQLKHLFKERQHPNDTETCKVVHNPPDTPYSHPTTLPNPVHPLHNPKHQPSTLNSKPQPLHPKHKTPQTLSADAGLVVIVADDSLDQLSILAYPGLGFRGLGVVRV